MSELKNEYMKYVKCTGQNSIRSIDWEIVHCGVFHSSTYLLLISQRIFITSEKIDPIITSPPSILTYLIIYTIRILLPKSHVEIVLIPFICFFPHTLEAIQLKISISILYRKNLNTPTFLN